MVYLFVKFKPININFQILENSKFLINTSMDNFQFLDQNQGFLSQKSQKIPNNPPKTNLSKNLETPMN